VDDGRHADGGRLDALAGPEVGGAERDPRRRGPRVAGEHADLAAAVVQPCDDMLPEAAGAAGDKDG
jgi:hypothetical protein